MSKNKISEEILSKHSSTIELEEEKEEAKFQYHNSQDQNESKAPWIKPNSKAKTTHGMLKLHYEILDFAEFIQLNDQEKEIRQKTFHRIKELLEKNFPQYKIKIFGSYMTDLSLPDSDIDIIILPKDSNKEKLTVKESNDELQKIYNYLFSKQKEKFNYLEYVKANVNIIKCILKETGIKIDISFYRKNGAAAVEVVKNAIKTFPQIRPLILVIKYFLRQRDLNDTFKGGVSSFVIFCLMYYFILDQRKISIYKKENNIKNEIMTLGHLLVKFFDFYGFQFNFEELGISIRQGGFLYKKKKDCKNILSVENFQDLQQDMGKGSFKFNKVLECFKIARDGLYYPSHSPIESYLVEFIKVDEEIKERAKAKQY